MATIWTSRQEENSLTDEPSQICTDTVLLSVSFISIPPLTPRCSLHDSPKKSISGCNTGLTRRRWKDVGWWSRRLCMYSHMHMHDYPQHTLACFNCSGLWMVAESWPNSTCARSSLFWCPLTFSSLLEAGKMIENKWMQYVFDSDLHLQNLLSSWHIKIQTLRSNSAPLHLFFYLLLVKLKINWRFANCDWTHSHPASFACTYFAVLCAANFLQCSKMN